MNAGSQMSTGITNFLHPSRDKCYVPWFRQWRWSLHLPLRQFQSSAMLDHSWNWKLTIPETESCASWTLHSFVHWDRDQPYSTRTNRSVGRREDRQPGRKDYFHWTMEGKMWSTRTCPNPTSMWLIWGWSSVGSHDCKFNLTVEWVGH